MWYSIKYFEMRFNILLIIWNIYLLYIYCIFIYRIFQTDRQMAPTKSTAQILHQVDNFKNRLPGGGAELSKLLAPSGCTSGKHDI